MKKISIFGCKWETLALKPWWSWAVRFYYVISILWTVSSKVGNRWFSFTLTRVAVITGSFVFLWDVIDWVCVIILHHASLYTGADFIFFIFIFYALDKLGFWTKLGWFSKKKSESEVDL